MKSLVRRQSPSNQYCLHTEQIPPAVLYFAKQCIEKVSVLCVTVRSYTGQLKTQNTSFAIKEITGPKCVKQNGFLL